MVRILTTASSTSSIPRPPVTEIIKWNGHIPQRILQVLEIYIFQHHTEFDVHVTMHRVKFLIIKPTRCINFSNLFLEWNSTCFGQFLRPSSGVFHCTHSNGICHTGLLTAWYTIAVCTVKNSWWWTEELSETCGVLFQEWIWGISSSSWFYYKKFITMYGHMNKQFYLFFFTPLTPSSTEG